MNVLAAGYQLLCQIEHASTKAFQTLKFAAIPEQDLPCLHERNYKPFLLLQVDAQHAKADLWVLLDLGNQGLAGAFSGGLGYPSSTHYGADDYTPLVFLHVNQRHYQRVDKRRDRVKVTTLIV